MGSQFPLSCCFAILSIWLPPHGLGWLLQPGPSCLYTSQWEENRSKWKPVLLLTTHWSELGHMGKSICKRVWKTVFNWVTKTLGFECTEPKLWDLNTKVTEGKTDIREQPILCTTNGFPSLLQKYFTCLLVLPFQASASPPSTPPHSLPSNHTGLLPIPRVFYATPNPRAFAGTIPSAGMLFSDIT